MQRLMPETLETDRLLLRQFKVEDWHDLQAYYGNEDCMRFTNGRALKDFESWRSMASMAGHWELRGYGPYAVEVKSSGKVAGPVGLWYPGEWPSPEIKWGVAEEFWRQGIAKEAASAVLRTAAIRLPNVHLISLILTGNTASVALAESIGAQYERDCDFRGQTAMIYRHKRPGT